MKQEHKQSIIFCCVPDKQHLAFYWAGGSLASSQSLKQALHSSLKWWLYFFTRLVSDKVWPAYC